MKTKFVFALDYVPTKDEEDHPYETYYDIPQRLRGRCSNAVFLWIEDQGISFDIVTLRHHGRDTFLIYMFEISDTYAPILKLYIPEIPTLDEFQRNDYEFKMLWRDSRD